MGRTIVRGLALATLAGALASTHAGSAADPPWELRVGVVHEHSGYSDGDPATTPADYFEAAKTGVNGDGTGVRLDFVLSSEHSDNNELPITTAAACLDPARMLECLHVDDPDHLDKWAATARQAAAATDSTFTAMRGFEWTNDIYNHMNVYLSTNHTNAKIDGGYVSMDAMWNWLRTPVAQGGGADALVTFNHPGRPPSLTPFDSGLPHSALLAALGGENWNDVAYVADVDERVAGMEVHGGDDLSFYVLALRNGWHLGPVAAEDEHGRNWASSEQGKTLMLTRGRTVADYYDALRSHRTVSVHADLIGGAPGERVTFPSILYWADAPSIQDDGAVPLGSVASGSSHVLHASIAGVPAASPVALVNEAGAVPVGVAGADGTLIVAHEPGADGWWFLVVCRPGSTSCGTDDQYVAVTAPIWLTG